MSSVPSLSWDDCRLLVETIAEYAIFMLDAEGYVTTWNLGAERIKGYPAHEIIGQHFSKFYLPEDVSAGKPQRALEIAREKGHVEDEGWRLRKDGSRFWANILITALEDESGKLRGFGKVTRDLTARRTAEAELWAAEQRFHLLVDAVVDYAIFMLDTGGHIATWNEGARRVKGYSAEEVRGRHFSIFYTPEDLAQAKPERNLEIVRREGRYEEESWRVRKDGTRFWANVVITALHGPDGALIGFAKVTRDLTSRRESEEKDRRLVREQAAREAAEEGERKLRESEERYRALSARLQGILEGLADGITVHDRTGQIVFANAAAAKLSGFESTVQLMKTSFEDVLAPFELLDTEGRPLAQDDLPARRVFAARDPTSAVIHMRERAADRHWWLLLRASAVLDSRGEPELAVNVWHDVSSERRRELQARYLAEATAALGGSLVYDEMLATLGRTLVPSMGAWCSISLVDGDHLREVTVAREDISNPDRAKEYRRRYTLDSDHADGLWKVLRTGVSQVFDASDDALWTPAIDQEALSTLRSLGINGTALVPIAVRGSVLGVIALVSAGSNRGPYDASDVALLEELGRRAGVALENAQLYAAAQEAAKAAARAAKIAEDASRAKDEFLATVSHELRTPLNAMLGWSRILKDRVKDPATSKPIEVIHRNAQAQVKIIDDILDVSRVITGKFRLDPRPADLIAIVRDAIEVVRPSADAKAILIQFAPSAEFCLLVADPERLQQVVWNLLSNAVKFTDARGEIHLSVRQEASQVVLVVADTGKGIEPAFLPVIFERFKQADSSTTRRVGGLGLGLSLVRHIVELHGGRVTAASEGLGRGSTFTITLPVQPVIPQPSESPEPSPVTGPSFPFRTNVVLNGVRVLVVDDEADARELAATVLTGAGAEVETAPSAAEGFETFKRFRPDVLVSDIGMPGEDGFAFIRRIRALPIAEGGRIPSLALTAFAREDDRTKALSAGFTTHIGKPVDPEALTSAIVNLAGFRWRN